MDFAQPPPNLAMPPPNLVVPNQIQQPGEHHKCFTFFNLPFCDKILSSEALYSKLFVDVVI